MHTREQILTLLREQQALLSRRYPIHRLALFGSWARGEAREDSDIDVLVEVDPLIGLRFVDLGDELERALGCRVDLVSRCVTGFLRLSREAAIGPARDTRILHRDVMR